MTAPRLLTVCVAILVAATISTGAAPVFVRDWTIATPIGRFGYAEIDYTLLIQVGPGPRKPDKVIFLGPLGQVSPSVGVGILLTAGLGILFLLSGTRKQKHESG